MGDAKQISPAEHKKQIEKYTVERPHYVTCATVMKRVLETACGVSIPEAFVQSRAKTVSSLKAHFSYHYPNCLAVYLIHSSANPTSDQGAAAPSSR